MTNQDVSIFQGGLIQVSNFGPVKFSHAVARNKMRVKYYIQKRDEEIGKKIDVEVINELRKKVQDDRIAICEEYCIKDEKGKPVLEQNNYTFEDMEAFNSIMKEAIGENQKLIVESDQEKVKMIQEWGVKEADLEVYMIAEEFLPEAINANQIEAIIWMITELSEELLGTSLKKEEEKPVAKRKKVVGK